MTDHPTFEEMTEAEQNELIVAAYRGQPVEFILDGNSHPKGCPIFYPKLRYRLKPEPVIEHHDFCLRNISGQVVGLVTYMTVDGKAQTGTFTNDKGETIIVTALE